MTLERGQPSRRVRVSPWRRSTGLGLRSESFLRRRSTSITPGRPAVSRTVLPLTSITTAGPARGKLLWAWLLVSVRNPTPTQTPAATSASANRPSSRRRPRRRRLIVPAVVLPAIASLLWPARRGGRCQHWHPRPVPAARPSGYPAPHHSGRSAMIRAAVQSAYGRSGETERIGNADRLRFLLFGVPELHGVRPRLRGAAIRRHGRRLITGRRDGAVVRGFPPVGPQRLPPKARRPAGLLHRQALLAQRHGPRPSWLRLHSARCAATRPPRDRGGDRPALLPGHRYAATARPAGSSRAAAPPSCMLARSALQQPATQQRRPGLPTNNPVHRKVLVGLEPPDGLLGLGAEVAVHHQFRRGAPKAPDEVQHGLQPLDRWTAEYAVAQHRQAERYLYLGLRSTHCGFPLHWRPICSRVRLPPDGRSPRNSAARARRTNIPGSANPSGRVRVAGPAGSVAGPARRSRRRARRTAAAAASLG